MNNLMHQDWLIIANGPLLSEAMLNKHTQGRKLMALDGALISCIERNIIPDIVLGDFDSLDQDIIQSAESKYRIKFIYMPEQDQTDLEKGIAYAAQFNPKSVIICQAIGGRSDHTIHNMRLLRRMHTFIENMNIISDTERFFFIKDKNVILSSDTIEPVALLAFPKAQVSSDGLKYDMDSLTLEFAKRESTSNHIIKNSAKISVQGEVLLIINHKIDITIC